MNAGFYFWLLWVCFFFGTACENPSDRKIASYHAFHIKDIELTLPWNPAKTGRTYIYSAGGKHKVFFYELRFYKMLLCLNLPEGNVDTISIDSLWQKADWIQHLIFYKDEKVLGHNYRDMVACLDLMTGKVNSINLNESSTNKVLKNYYLSCVGTHYDVTPESLLVFWAILKENNDSLNFNLDNDQDFFKWNKTCKNDYAIVLFENGFDDSRRKIRFVGKGLMNEIMNDDQYVGAAGLCYDLLITHDALFLYDDFRSIVLKLDIKNGIIVEKYEIQSDTLVLKSGQVLTEDVFKNKEVKVIRKSGSDYHSNVHLASYSNEKNIYLIMVINSYDNKDLFSYLIYDKQFNKLCEIPFLDGKFIPRVSLISNDGFGFFMYASQNSGKQNFKSPKKYKFALFDFSDLMN